MKTSTKNVAASVRAQLLRLARQRDEDFQLVLTRFANERLLFRLASSPYAGRFVLKGATLFTLWMGEAHRATRDLDLLAFDDPDEDHLRQVFATVLALDVPDDGVRFDLGSLRVGRIREEQEYGGLRLEVVAQVTTAQVRVQVDIGFGDAITPQAKIVEIPSLLDFPPPHLRAYPRETVVAEKFEAMVQLGMANSRMKDFYDIALLARRFDFEVDVLAPAIRATFERRKTPLPTELPVALTTTFADDPAKKTQWAGFVRKASVRDAGSLSETITAVAAFIELPLNIALTQKSTTQRWQAGGPWR